MQAWTLAVVFGVSLLLIETTLVVSRLSRADTWGREGVRPDGSVVGQVAGAAAGPKLADLSAPPPPPAAASAASASLQSKLPPSVLAALAAMEQQDKKESEGQQRVSSSSSSSSKAAAGASGTGLEVKQ